MQPLWHPTSSAMRRTPQLLLPVPPPRHCVYCCMHTHRSCTPAFLAQLFRIRQQRVMAILALKQLEAQAEAEYVKVGFTDNNNHSSTAKSYYPASASSASWPSWR